jgi:hypothetical protein
VASAASKALFLAAWTGLVVAVRAGRLRLAAARASQAAMLAFLTLYGLQSAQYLLWVVPLGLLWPGRASAVYAAAATTGLLGFYLFLAPGVLVEAPLVGGAAGAAGRLWLFGAATTLAASAGWLVALARTGDGRPFRAGS